MDNPAAALLNLSDRGRARDFFQGFSLPFAALGLVFGDRRLFRLTALSAVLTAGSLVGVVALDLAVSPRVTGWIWQRPEGGLFFLWAVLLALVFALLLVLGATTIPVLLLAPLQDPLSEATEALCGDFTPQPFSFPRMLAQTISSLTHTLGRITWLLLGHALLLALHLLPVVGVFVWTFAAQLWTVAWLAAEYLDGPMIRHGYPFSHVRRAVSARLALSLGFGTAVYLILWVPILNLFFMPLAIVGGTLLFRGLRSAGVLNKQTLER